MTEIQNALLKSETIRQLKARRDTFEQSAQFARTKIVGLSGNVNQSAENSKQLNEFKIQLANCNDEIDKISSCINWINKAK